jgi:hypothetical protein
MNGGILKKPLQSLRRNNLFNRRRLLFFSKKKTNPKDSFSKEGIMDVKNYCKNVDIELNAWRAKLYNVMRQMDDLPTGDKQRMYEKVNGLHIIVTELDERIDQLRTKCPTEWTPEKSEIKGKISDLEEQYNEVDSFFY